MATWAASGWAAQKSDAGMYEDGQLCDMGRFSEPADDPTGQSAARGKTESKRDLCGFWKVCFNAVRLRVYWYTLRINKKRPNPMDSKASRV